MCDSGTSTVDESIFDIAGTICRGMYEYVLQNLSFGSTILELGSGYTSPLWAKHYTVYSVEHDEGWLNKFDEVNYIYVPISKHKEVKNLAGTAWYDWEELERQIKDIDYDLVIVDGPPIKYGRAGFRKYVTKFPKRTPILFDDLNRGRDLKVALRTAVWLNEPLLIMGQDEDKRWGVIWPGKFKEKTDD